jgi:hypothetical protein
MFARHITRSFQLVLGAVATGAIVGAAPAQAADPVEHTPSTMNQASVYESTLKFYLHPARLEWGNEAPRPRMDHPAVIVARRAPAPYDWTAAFILHPARLALSLQPSHPMFDHPAVAVAKARHAAPDAGGEAVPHPATVAKAAQLPVIHTSGVGDHLVGE